MDAASALTQGALRRISEGEDVVEPIVQCVQIKPMAPGANGQERYRDVLTCLQVNMAMPIGKFALWSFLMG